MASGSGIFNAEQTYGNGLVTMQGSFTDNGTTVTVTHGKGFTVARASTTGCYLVTLQYGFKGMHSGQVAVNSPASTGNGSFSHPGFGLAGDLQSNSNQNNQFYIYSYNSSTTQAWLGTTAICCFECVFSMSNLNP